MKKILFLLAFIAFGISVSAQSAFDGFLFPVSDNPTIVKSRVAYEQSKALSTYKADSSYVLRLVRFNVGVGGVQVLRNKVEKEWKPEAFTKVGIGLSYSFFKVDKGEASNYLSLNGFLFLPVTEANQTISIAASISAYRIFKTEISPSIGVNFEPSLIKSDYFPLAPLLSLKYNFN